ncbi:hypothetical protein CC78DRAFT_585968 [Lojkania enalia]|uniref:Uncharacterized protein n=1 Tax=Lojkania enalia TaxID=147567 RepID=A0A9P4K258_9PLEO|nr:hypothetical protein CC78DRAFT_585968 [Didymosphaeria enalia]
MPKSFQEHFTAGEEYYSEGRGRTADNWHPWPWVLACAALSLPSRTRRVGICAAMDDKNLSRGKQTMAGMHVWSAGLDWEMRVSSWQAPRGDCDGMGTMRFGPVCSHMACVKIYIFHIFTNDHGSYRALLALTAVGAAWWCSSVVSPTSQTAFCVARMQTDTGSSSTGEGRHVQLLCWLSNVQVCRNGNGRELCGRVSRASTLTSVFGPNEQGGGGGGAGGRKGAIREKTGSNQCRAKERGRGREFNISLQLFGSVRASCMRTEREKGIRPEDTVTARGRARNRITNSSHFLFALIDDMRVAAGAGCWVLRFSRGRLHHPAGLVRLCCCWPQVLESVSQGGGIRMCPPNVAAPVRALLPSGSWPPGCFLSSTAVAARVPSNPNPTTDAVSLNPLLLVSGQTSSAPSVAKSTRSRVSSRS